MEKNEYNEILTLQRKKLPEIDKQINQKFKNLEMQRLIQLENNRKKYFDYLKNFNKKTDTPANLTPQSQFKDIIITEHEEFEKQLKSKQLKERKEADLKNKELFKLKREEVNLNQKEEKDFANTIQIHVLLI